MGNNESSSADNNNNQDSTAQQQQDAGENPSYWQMLRMGKDALVNAIIRPPRAEYSIAELGPPTFTYCGKSFKRTDLTLRNPKNQAIACSWWQLTDTTTTTPQPCVIYMHGNASCRSEAVGALGVCFSAGASVFAFDFSGCGMSEGEFISLGFFERDDLAAVTDYLRASGVVTTIGLWGRSMGAATALLHGHRDPSIAGMVLDSPFADLTQLARELVEHARGEGYVVPSILVTGALKYIGSQVRSRAGFDIKDLRPEADVDKCFIPALFAHAQEDDFIAPHHSQQIHDKYAGDKNLIMFEGDHASERPDFFYNSVGIFFHNCLRSSADNTLSFSEDANCSPTPPWLVGRYRQMGYYDNGFLRVNQFDAEDEMLRAAMAASLNLGETPATSAPTTAPSNPPPRSTVAAEAPQVKAVDESLVELLAGMGFPSGMAREALRRTNGNIETALDLLTTGRIPETFAIEQQSPPPQQQQHTNPAERLGAGVVRLDQTLLNAQTTSTPQSSNATQDPDKAQNSDGWL